MSSEHSGQESLEVLAEAAAGKRIEDGGEAAVEEGDALCHLQRIVQVLADLAVPKDLQVQQRVQKQGDVVREPQHKEGHHQAYGHPQSPALAWGPQPGQDGANAGIEEDRSLTAVPPNESSGHLHRLFLSKPDYLSL